MFAWRKLYFAGKLVEKRSKLVVPTAAARLLPVSIHEDKPQAEIVISDAQERPSVSHRNENISPCAGAIHIQFARVQVRVEGAVDASVLRAVLESLRG